MMHTHHSLDRVTTEQRHISEEQPTGLLGILAVLVLLAIVALTIWFLLVSSPSDAQAPPADVEVTLEVQP